MDFIILILILMALCIHRGHSLHMGMIVPTNAIVAVGLSVMTSINPPIMSARELVNLGAKQFVQGDVKESRITLDRAAELYPNIIPVLWQRGISQYYTQEYKGCRDQFEGDVSLNPSDTEEIVWAEICHAAYEGLPTAYKESKTLPSRDARPVMKYVYDLFKTEPGSDLQKIQEDQLKEAGSKVGDPGALFYSRLYLGLYKMAENQNTEAIAYFKEALDTSYASKYNDFMIAVARNSITSIEEQKK